MSTKCLYCGPTEGCEHITIKGNTAVLHIQPTLRKLYAPESRPDFTAVFGRMQEVMIRLRQEQDARERALEAAWDELRARVQKAMRATKGVREHMKPIPPANPRERALWLKENRNTGPDRSQYKHRGQK